MDSLQFVKYLLACYGMTFILVYGHIFDKIRPAAKFFHCPLCMGFHVGWIMLLIYGWLMLGFNVTILECFFFACISSGFSYTVSMLSLWLERKAHGEKE